MPLVVGERVLGALLFTFVTPRRFSAEDDAFLRAKAGQIAQSLERARLYEAERHAREIAESANRRRGSSSRSCRTSCATPLNSISGYVELLEMGIRGPVTPAQREDLHRIQEGQQQLLLLLNEVLNYARLESGAVTYDLQPTIVADVVTATMRQFEPQRAAKMLKVVARALACDGRAAVRRDGRPGQAAADPAQPADQHGAVHAGGRTREGALHAAAGRRRRASRSASATPGIDIPDDRHDAIFEPFVQVGRTSSERGPGHGPRPRDQPRPRARDGRDADGGERVGERVGVHAGAAERG